MKSSWELDAELVEQLRGSDIRKPFEAAAHQWPDHRERVVYGLVGFGINRRCNFPRERFDRKVHRCCRDTLEELSFDIPQRDEKTRSLRNV